MNLNFLSFILTVGFCHAAFIDQTIEDYSVQTDVDSLKNEKYEAAKCICPKFPRPSDCSEVLANGHNVSGVYTIHPKSRAVDCDSLEVYCDMDTDGGGWTVIQRRGNFGNGENYFVKNWQTYKKGFGNINKEFWLGNDNIHAITNQDSYSVRIDLKRLNGEERFALYDTFYIDDEEQNYRLHIREFSGTTNDAISNHHLSKFYTLDRPNYPTGRKEGDKMHKGGWWLNKYPSSNINGLNRQKILKQDGEMDSIVWSGFRFHESLAATQIAVRPKKFHA